LVWAALFLGGGERGRGGVTPGVEKVASKIFAVKRKKRIENFEKKKGE